MKKNDQSKTDEEKPEGLTIYPAPSRKPRRQVLDL